MIPQGFFLMNDEPESMAEAHAAWAMDIDMLGPWEACGHECGNRVQWLKGGKQSDARVVMVNTCGSTMELARDLAEKGVLGEWGSVVSVVQHGGRGQLRRPWVSLPGNFHASIVMPKPVTSGPWAESLSRLLPLVVGSVVADCLESLGAAVCIKWPNDILQDDRKVGGMLIEEKGDLTILGLGLNLAGCPSDEQMRDDLSPVAGVLKIQWFKGGPAMLLEALVNRGKKMYKKKLDEISPTRFIHTIENKLAWMGRPILVREGGEDPYEATLVGLSLEGGLVVLRGGEETVLFSGSIFPL